MAEVFKLTPPQSGAKPFFARIDYEPRILVYSTRNNPNQWELDPKLQFEDLLMPEQGPLYDWDVEKIE